MKSAEDCQNMTEIREAIDAIDYKIVSLVAERAGYVKAAAEFKSDEASVRDEERVHKVISSKRMLAAELGVSPVLVEKIYRVMIEYFINEEMKEWKSTSSK